MKAFLLFCLLSLFAFTLAQEENDEKIRLYHGHKVLRVIPQTEAQLTHLHEFAINSRLDFWREPTALDVPVDIRVEPAQLTALTSFLRSLGLEIEFVIEDVQALIDETSVAQSVWNGDLKDFAYNKYHTFQEIQGWIDAITGQYRDLTEKFVIGKSYESRDIVGFRISPKPTVNRSAIWLEGGIHAREWISPATVIYMAAQFVEGYGKVPNITAILDKYDIYILPVFNPDGYEYTKTDRAWRKTRAPNQNSRCIGTDPNRNWEFHWGEAGASTDPCSDSYQGPSPFSSIEVKSVANYIKARSANIKYFIDFHAYSQLWMSPWGYTSAYPADYDDQNALSAIAVSALSKWYGTTYKYGTISRIIYPASGSSADYTYGVCKIKYSYGVELRDTGRFGFLLPDTQIVPSGQETLSAVIASIQNMK